MKTTKRWLSLLLFLVMMIGVITVAPVTASAISDSEIKSQLDQIITNEHKPGSTGMDCYAFVTKLSNKLYGHNLPSQDKTVDRYRFTDSYKDNFTQIGTTLVYSSGTLTETSLKNLFLQSKPGDVVQMNYTTWKGESSFHTMMVYSASQSGVIFYHAGKSKIYFGVGTGADKLNGTTGQEITWSQLFNTHLSSAGDGISVYRSKTVNTCSHTYDGVGICSKCNYQFPYDNDRNASYAGTYKVKSGTTAYIRKGPYQKCTEVTHTTSGTFTVLARVLNCKGNYWYELSYNNSTCYVVADNLEPSHVHIYSIGYESAHPHKQYKKCSCGYYEYTGSTQKVSGCTACYPVSSYGSTNPDDYTYPDPDTTDTIYRTSPTMKGSTVAWVQAVLYQLGYSIEVDGSYGQNSETVIKQFQSDNGLEVDGRVGPATKRKLLELWNAKKVENSHTCDKKTSSYQASHPHYLVYKCSVCGKEQVDTSITQRMDSCNSCLPEKSVLTVVPGTGTEQTKFTWKAAGGADCYELKIFEAGNDTPLHWLFNLTTTQYELLLPPGDYVGYVVSLNIDLIDTSNYFVYSDKVEFSVLEDEVLTPFASTEYNGNRYELFDVTMSWTEAKFKCAELGGHLVTISSEEEMDKIMSIVSVGEMATYWIGYSDEDTEDYWRSVTGEEITYTNWDVGQPDDYNNAEDYALIKNQQNGKWNDVKNEYSDVSVGFICEYEGDASEDVTEPSTGNEDEPIAPTEPSTNDEDKPTESTEPSTDDEYKPTQPANPSTGDEDKPTEPTNPSTGDEDEPTNPVVTSLLGDANEDGKVNIKDATLIQKSIANLTELTETGEALADADLNTKINIKDATAIQKHIAGIETGYPIGKPKTK